VNFGKINTFFPFFFYFTSNNVVALLLTDSDVDKHHILKLPEKQNNLTNIE